MRSFDYQYPVWTYTCVDGPNAGDIIETLPSSFNHGQSLCAVRNTASHRVSAISFEKIPNNCGKDVATTNAHGIITQDGWGTAIYPSCSLQGIDGAALLPYSIGERIWIEESLLPTDEDSHIPVVSLDTGNLFKMPSKHICYVPELKGSGANGAIRYITIAGPIHAVIVDGQAWRIQGYLEQQDNQSPHAILKWKKWRTGCSEGGLSEFEPLKDEQERRRVFDNQWANLWVDSDHSSNTALDRNRCQLEPNQLLPPEPRRIEHLHTPPSRHPNANLSKRALRMANIPYRPLPRTPSAQSLCVTRTSPTTQCSHPSCNKGRCSSSSGAAEATPNTVCLSRSVPPSEYDSDMPLVVNLKIEFDPATRDVEVSSSPESCEDYEMV